MFGLAAGSIDILNAYQPFAVMGARFEITTDSSYERAKVQRPGRRRSKTASIDRGVGQTHDLET
jgi:hypothetical protein